MPKGQYIRGACLLDRFMSHVEVQPSGCWWWMGMINKKNGYGIFMQGKKIRTAHRVSYEIHTGPIPEGLHIDHTCHKKEECYGGPTCPHRRCVNPLHLEAVAPEVNRQRGHNRTEAWSKQSAERQRTKTHCPH